MLFDAPFLAAIASAIKYIGGSRNSLFFALPMLLIGAYIAKKPPRLKRATCVILFVVTFALSFLEATIIKNDIGMEITLDVSIFGWMPAVPLFIFGLENMSRLSQEKSRMLRKVTDWVYIIHIWVYVLLSKLLGLDHMYGFVMTVLVSFVISVGLELALIRVQKVAG